MLEDTTPPAPTPQSDNPNPPAPRPPAATPEPLPERTQTAQPVMQVRNNSDIGVTKQTPQQGKQE